MSARWRLVLSLALATVVIAGVLAWWQWPMSDDRRAPGPARAAEIEALRTAIERERAALEAARQRQDHTEEELRALRDSLQRHRERIRELERSLPPE